MRTGLKQIYQLFDTRTKTNSSIGYIEDLTRVGVSYEIYETRLRRVSKISYEMTTRVGFCLS